METIQKRIKIKNKKYNKKRVLRLLLINRKSHIYQLSMGTKIIYLADPERHYALCYITPQHENWNDNRPILSGTKM